MRLRTRLRVLATALELAASGVPLRAAWREARLFEAVLERFRRAWGTSSTDRSGR